MYSGSHTTQKGSPSFFYKNLAESFHVGKHAQNMGIREKP